MADLGDLADKLDRADATPSLDAAAEKLDQQAAGLPYVGAADPTIPLAAVGAPEHPGSFSVKRIGEAIAEPFQNVPNLIPSPQALLDVAEGTAATLDPGLLPRATRHQLMTTSGQHLQDALENGFTALGATYEAALGGFNQLLKELQFSNTSADRTTREVARFFDYSMFAGSVAPSTAVINEGRATSRALTGAAAKEQTMLEKAMARDQALQDRAENLAEFGARQEARKKAPAGATKEERQLAEDVAAARARTGVRETRDNIVADNVQTDALAHNPGKIVDEVPGFTQQTLNQPTIRKALDVARDVMVEKGMLAGDVPASPERVTQTIINSLSDGSLAKSDFMGELSARGVTDHEFLQMLGETSSEAGRTLQQFSVFRQYLQTLALRGDEGAQKVLADLADKAQKEAERQARGLKPGVSPTEAAEPFIRQGSRLFRKLLVTLPSTAVRNFIESWGTRVLLQTANRALDTTFKRVFRPGDPLIEPVNAFDEWYRSVTPEGRRMTRGTLDPIFAAFPDVRHKLWSTLEADIAMNRAHTTGRFLDRAEAGIDNVLLWANRTQSKLVRGPIFAAQLDRELQKLGVSLEDVVDYGKIPAGFDRAMSNAMELALYTDYTMSPKSGVLGKTMKAYADLIDALPGGALFEPFPRFIYNALKLISEQMPTAGLRLLGPKERAKIASGDYEAVARELTGTALYATAWALRKGYIPGVKPGPNWDEVVDKDGNVISMSPYVVFAAPLFLADLSIRAEDGRLPVDFNQRAFQTLREGLIGRGPQIEYGTATMQQALNYISGINDLADWQRFGEALSDKVLSGALRPFQLFRDFGTAFDETWNIQRETRGQGIFAPVAEVFAPDQLPPRHLPTRTDPAKVPQVPIPFTFGLTDQKISGNIARHVTGTLWRDKRNAIENELATMGFDTRNLVAKTGDPLLDNLVAQGQGPAMQYIGELLVQSPTYLDLPTSTKREVLRQLVTATREIGLKYAEAVAPSATALRHLRGMPGLQRQMVFDTLNSILEGRGAGLDVEGLGDYVINQLKSAREVEKQRALQLEQTQRQNQNGPQP